MAQFAHQQLAAARTLGIIAGRHHDLIGKVPHLTIRLKDLPNALENVSESLFPRGRAGQKVTRLMPAGDPVDLANGFEDHRIDLVMLDFYGQAQVVAHKSSWLLRGSFHRWYR